jgi:hypothetical protein
MEDFYKIAIRINLDENVTKGLLGLSKQFTQLSKHVDLLQSKINQVKNLWGIGSNLINDSFTLVGKALKPASDYVHQLNIMNMAGLKQQEIAESVATAWKTSKDVLSSTATGNLVTWLDIRNTLGSSKEASILTPLVTDIGAVLQSALPSGSRIDSDKLAFSMAKALDIRGAAINPGTFTEQALMMAKVITAFQGKVLPQDYQMLFKYGRQATPGLSNQFLYQELPTFMMEMKGAGGGGSSGGFGSALAAGYRFFVQGIMNKRSAESLAELGLIPRSSILKTTTTGTTLKGGVKDAALFQSDPFLWVQKDLLPSIRKKYGDNLTNSQLTMIINQIMKGNQVAEFEILQYALKAQNVYRDQKIIQGAKNAQTALQYASSSDPAYALSALSAQWDNFATAFSMSVVPVMVPGLIKLSTGLNYFSDVVRRNQDLAKKLSFGFIGLAGALAISGSVVILVGALTALVSPVGLVVVGISALTAWFYSLYKAIQSIYSLYKTLKTSGLIDNNTLLGRFNSSTTSASNVNTIAPYRTVHFTLHNSTTLEGRLIAQSVSKHQARAGTQPTSQTSSFDNTRQLQPVGWNSPF